MNLFLQSLLRLTEKDLRADLNPQQVWYSWNVSSNATTLNPSAAHLAALTALIPADKCLLLTHLFCRAIPDVTLISTGILFRFGSLDPNGVFQAVVNPDLKATGTPLPATAGAEVVLSFEPQGCFPMFTGQLIHTRATFSAATATNTFFATLFGVLVPRANWQRA